MQIKDVSEKTGISSNNIRFYEKVKLVEAKRNEINGYREYSDEDVKKLKVVVKLRELDICIEEIRTILNDECEIHDVLENQLKKADEQIDKSNKIKSICSKLAVSQVVDLTELLDIEEFKTMKTAKSSSTILGADLFNLLPENVKLKYYEAIIRKDNIDELVLDDLSMYINEILYNSFSNEKIIKKLITASTGDTKTKIINMLKEHNFELYHNVSKYIYDIEEVITVPDNILQNAIRMISRAEILITLKAVSPNVKDKIINLYDDEKLLDDLSKMVPIPLSEVIEIHEKIISNVNELVKQIN